MVPACHGASGLSSWAAREVVHVLAWLQPQAGMNGMDAEWGVEGVWCLFIFGDYYATNAGSVAMSDGGLGRNQGAIVGVDSPLALQQPSVDGPF
jgi:hypothetical protein